MVELGLSQNDYWQTSPEAFSALVDAWKKRTYRESERFAGLMALIANCNRSEGTPAFTVADFLRSPSGRKRNRENRRKRAAAVTAYFEALVVAGVARKEEGVK